MELLEKPINGFGSNDTSEFVTVVSVGSLNEPKEDISSGYVTVLTIGDDNSECKEKIEDVLVYRLPGERLGFGLKFEGGTKASEFVKRLFIQSCAPDSPASRVRSSWGCLTEGDEVLEIDSIPVKSMTRIDCVRCLKDSNVVIKLLVKHKSDEAQNQDLPLVIGAEKKRTPPPPPPVPPRKIPRKLCKNETIVIPPKAFTDTTEKPQENGLKNRHQSPRNSGRLLQPRQSPEVAKRDRRLSDGSIGPPDAEVYVDLFSQESPYCLSESDDTGSSISTVVDRLGSFPTTTTSSFAGSLPSTPTSIQKQMDLSHVLNPFDEEGDYEHDNYLFTKLVSLQNEVEVEKKVEKFAPLQPPANFQDAPLSYGDEDVRIVEAAIKNEVESLSTKRRPPPPPPRSKHSIKEKNNNDYDAKNEYCENLPRLVDFVPKSNNSESYEDLKKFLENEQRSCDYEHTPIKFENENSFNNWSEGNEFYTYNWSPSSQLATIGEDEEEGFIEQQLPQRSPNPSTPIVIVENADEKEPVSRKDFDEPDGLQEPSDTDVADSVAKTPEPAARTTPRSASPPDVEVMEAPSINSRQPPDGHEFPDYQEAPIISKPIMSDIPAKIPTRKDPASTKSVRNMIAIFSNNTSENVPDGEPNDTLNKKGLSKSVMNINTTQSSLNSYNLPPPTSTPNTHHSNRSSLDLSHTSFLSEKTLELANSPIPRLHTRSQSLIDISDKKETDRWTLLVEQRRRGLSKLKGLIIPEHSDPDESVAVIDLPEIKSTAPPVPPITNTKPNFQIPNHSRNSSTPTLAWNTETTNAIPKYSPAFKRKTLQLHNEDKLEKPKPQKAPSQIDDECRIPTTLSLSDAPKSLESITSPTRSDCSFEYISSSPELKNKQPEPRKLFQNTGKSEDESDNDSAVSSSQSSYISRTSPPVSPNHLHFTPDRKYDDLQTDSLNRRLLKPQSVEAINRKNILASAKCRSGRDLKVGSPLIQRKFDETEAKPEEKIEDFKTPETNGYTKDAEKETKRAREPIDFNKIVPRSIARNNRTTSVTDLRKNFEKLTPAVTRTPVGAVKAQSRLSLNLSQPPMPVPAKRNSLPVLPQVITKTTNVDSCKIIEDTLKNLDEVLTKDELKVIVLCSEIPGGSIGITLAGGTDYETKDITVHKVRSGSAAFRDGRLHKGDRIISINGKSMKGVTHAESIAILKEPVPEVILVACAGKEAPTTPSVTVSRHNSMFDLSTTPATTPTSKEVTPAPSKKQEEIVVTLLKDIAGLGFSMEGGKESPQGDVPLVIKKLFTGGSADKCGKLKAGDELMEINGTDVTQMPRIDAWNLMKKLPNGEVMLRVRR